MMIIRHQQYMVHLVPRSRIVKLSRSAQPFQWWIPDWETYRKFFASNKGLGPTCCPASLRASYCSLPLSSERLVDTVLVRTSGTAELACFTFDHPFKYAVGRASHDTGRASHLQSRSRAYEAGCVSPSGDSLRRRRRDSSYLSLVSSKTTQTQAPAARARLRPSAGGIEAHAGHRDSTISSSTRQWPAHSNDKLLRIRMRERTATVLLSRRCDIIVRKGIAIAVDGVLVNQLGVPV